MLVKAVNDKMYQDYSSDFNLTQWKSKAVDIVMAFVGGRFPPAAIAGLIDGVVGAGIWIEVLGDMREARDKANETNCDCSKTAYIPN